jgi:glycosyltransferase involved in cell wall biosynthesis
VPGHPLISVIIPCFNAAFFLQEAIESVLNQNYPNLQLIVVNDGSTDNSLKIAKQYEKDNVLIIDKLNTGVSDSRNQGAQIAKGKYLAFLDADDVWKAEKLKESIEVFEEHNVGLVHTYMEVINEESLPTGEILKGKKGNLLESLLLWNGCNIPSPSSILISKSAFDEVGGFDPSFSTAADQDFFFRLATKFNVGIVKKPLGQYRVHSNNMHSNIELMEKDHIGVYEKASKAGLFKSKSFEKKCFANLYKILAGSWWKDGNNKLKGLKFIIKSILIYPPIVKKYFS